MDRKLTIADMASLVAGVAASLGCLTLYLRSARIDPRILIDYQLAAATTILAPLSWTLAVLAMLHTRRRRWLSHPAVAVGIAVAAAVIVVSLDAARFIYTAPLGPGEGPFQAASRRMAWSLRSHIGGPLLAVVLAAALGGRLGRPKGWLAWAAIAVGICWFVVWSFVYLRLLF